MGSLRLKKRRENFYDEIFLYYVLCDMWDAATQYYFNIIKVMRINLLCFSKLKKFNGFNFNI